MQVCPDDCHACWRGRILRAAARRRDAEYKADGGDKAGFSCDGKEGEIMRVVFGKVLCVIWVYIFVANQIPINSAVVEVFRIPAFFLQLVPGMVLKPVLPEWALDPIRGICVSLPQLSVSGAAVVYLPPGICLVIAGTARRSGHQRVSNRNRQTWLPPPASPKVRPWRTSLVADRRTIRSALPSPSHDHARTPTRRAESPPVPV
jgi:hypothetical protein